VTTSLAAEPRWAEAAQALVEACIDLPADEDRVALLAAVCEGLGDELYPAFLRVLALIGQHGEHGARAAVALTLVHALRTGRLPSGRRSAWGASASQQVEPGYRRTRSLGPIEYLCAWHAQADPDQALSAEQFEAAASAVMELVAASREARLLYCEKLIAEADDPISGALTRSTREALRALAAAWAEGAAATDASARFLATLPPTSKRSLASLVAQPAFPAR